VHKKILKFSDFTSEIRPKAVKIQEDVEPTILQQVTNQAGNQEKKAGVEKPDNLKNISVSDIFYGTSVGKKFITDLTERPELAKLLVDKGLVPKDIIEPKELSQSEIKANTENQINLNIPTATDAENKANSRAIESEDYKFDDIKNLNWEGLKYILEKRGLSKSMNFKKYNLVGLRNFLKVKQSYPNKFIDALILMSPEGEKKLKIMPGTTVPGPLLMVEKERNRLLARTNVPLNPKGLAILQPGVYSYKIGSFKNYPSLIQNGSVKVERFPIVDTINKAKFTTFSPGKAEVGNSGILFHRANKSGTTENVDYWSAGCIVLKNGADLDYIIQKMKSDNQNTIDFALAEMDEIPPQVLATAIKKDKDSKSGSV
jgi:hypothetical protein